MSEKMIRTQVYLPRDIYEQLKDRADTEGIAMATQIREALVQYVTKSPAQQEGHILTADDPIWNIIGMIDSGITDGSVNHDKYIYTRHWDPEEDV